MTTTFQHKEELKALRLYFDKNIEKLKEIILRSVGGDNSRKFIFPENSLRIKKSSSRKGLAYYSNLIPAFYGKNKLSVGIGLKDFVDIVRLPIFEVLKTFESKKMDILINDKGIISFNFKIDTQTEELGGMDVNHKGSNTRDGELGTFCDGSKFDLYEAKPRKFETKLVPSSFSYEKFLLYNRYNKLIHKDEEETELESFKKFVCARNIVEETFLSVFDGEKKMKVGCYHQEFYLDGKLIGVALQRYLKTGMQSGYFFYEPILKNLNLGILSSLFEIEKIQEFNKDFPGFKYYYLSTYIHENFKLKYKSDYRPVEIWCPHAKKFLDFEDESVQKKLKEKKVQLSNPNELVYSEVQKEDEFSSDLPGFLAEVFSLRKVLIKDEVELRGFLGKEDYDVPLENGEETFREYKIDNDVIYEWLTTKALSNYWLFTVFGKKLIKQLRWIQEVN